jgi:hypothetical protein
MALLSTSTETVNSKATSSSNRPLNSGSFALVCRYQIGPRRCLGMFPSSALSLPIQMLGPEASTRPISQWKHDV